MASRGRNAGSFPLNSAAAGGLAIIAVGILVTICVGWVDGLAIYTPTFVDITAAVAGVGLVFGLVDRPRRWWLSWGVGIATVDSCTVAAAHYWVSASGLIAEHYPPTMLVWVWLGLWAAGVGLTGWWSGSALARTTRILAAPFAVATAFVLINAHYGYWPTVGVVLGHSGPGEVSAPVLVRAIDLRRSEPAGGPVAWKRSLGQRAIGIYGSVSIPDRPVSFPASSAWVWLPPAYFSSPLDQLPVLVMLTGLPGTAHDWITAGQVSVVADSWARDHNGVAPVMVFVDENGRGGRDTECVNGPQGQAASYLTEDLPAWISGTLGITLDPSRWGVVGFSEGGTCALDLAIEGPGMFDNFIDVAGDPEPNHGNRSATLRYLYGDNALSARSYQPEEVLATRRYEHLNGWLAAGTGDQSSLRDVHALAPLAARAGVAVRVFEGPGGHTWLFARVSFARIYPTLVSVLTGPVTVSEMSSPGPPSVQR